MGDRRPARGETVGAALFARYAEADLDRWRTLIGGEVVHADPRWGTGRVDDVRWGTCCEHVSPYIQVRVRYPGHGKVVFRAPAFGAHHRSVAVPPKVRRVIRACCEEEREEAEREAILERHTRELRDARDRLILDRARALRKRALERTRREADACRATEDRPRRGRGRGRCR